MRRWLTGSCSLLLTASALAATTPVREVEIRSVNVSAPLPTDLASPEGKTRWNLESLVLGARTTVAISSQDNGFVQATRGTGSTAPSRLALSGNDAERWLLPDQDPAQMKMGARVSLQFDETRDGLVDRLVADVATVGIGWVLLPGDPKEVVLQRVLVSRQRAGERAMRPETLIHRWVNPREGVVAAVSGPASADGRSRLSVDSAEIVVNVLAGAATMKLYSDQIYRGIYTDIEYGWDRGPSAAVSSMVPNPGISNMCQLVALDTWNFSAINSGKETATTEVPSELAQSCNANGCGYAGYPVGGGLETPILERYDRDLTGTLRKDNQVIQKDVQATGVTFWLRAGDQNENVSGSFGSGETRFCFTDEAGKPRNEVPVWRMLHNDASGWYTQAGDTWGSDPIPAASCQQSFYNCQCGSCGGLFQTLYSRSCSASSPTQPYAGSQFSKVVKGGVVVLPSGHTLNALVVRNTTEFCTYTGSGCTGILAPVRTIVYIFEAPYVGLVALLRGPQNTLYTAAELPPNPQAETPCTNLTSLDYTNISFGLLPPVSITAGATTNTSVSLSWNPGNDTHRIVTPNGYKIYWDTDPGASSAYAFNSVTNAGQVVFAGTTATISGLTLGTTYYFTVTSLSDFTEPLTNPPVSTRFESIKYPTTVSGDPSFSYPVEVAATPGCTPAAPVANVKVDKALPNIHVCWDATAEACPVGYDVVTSDSGPGGFATSGQVGLQTCWDGNPTQANPLLLIQVRARGTNGVGP